MKEKHNHKTQQNNDYCVTKKLNEETKHGRAHSLGNNSDC